MQDNQKFKDAVEFLLFTYFGLEFELEDGSLNSVLTVALEKAYNDATLQGAYNALKKNIEKGNSLKEDAMKILNSELQILLSKNSAHTDYDTWHKNTCNKLMNHYAHVTYTNKNGDFMGNAFTYGNAQKFVNMTMKYISLLRRILKVYLPCCEFCNLFGTRIDELEEKFHVPVDSYIIEAVQKGPYKNHLGKKPEVWSKWNSKQYLAFSQGLNNELDKSPLEWEHKEWIRISKSRKQKEKQKKTKN